MRTLFIALLAAVGLMSFHSGIRNHIDERLSVYPVFQTGQPGLRTPARGMEDEILQYVNEHRAGLGLAPLKLDEAESRIAAKHSENMATGKTGFGHSGFNGRAKAIQKALGSVTAVAENVAEGPMTAREVVDGWLHSPGHKKNIEGNYTLTGIGYALDKKGNIFFTQLFSR